MSNNLTDYEITVDFEVDEVLDVQLQSVYEGASIDDTTISTKKTWSSQKISDELDLKADKSTTYTKTEVDTALGAKADKSTTYTKNDVDLALLDKADKSDTYTKAQIDNFLLGKANAYRDISGTLTAGQTSITLYDSSITTSSLIEIFTTTGVGYSDINATTGNVTVTFYPQSTDIGVLARISGAAGLSEIGGVVGFSGSLGVVAANSQIVQLDG